MAAVFITSDTHFSHALVAGIRGFARSDEHDEHLVARWNDTVRPGDTVWHLGDVGMGSAVRVLPWAARLNGHKHLVTGNHDECWPGHRDAHKKQRRWLEVFESVQQYARRRIGGHQVMLSHFPYDGDHTNEERASQYRLRDEGLWLLHGHTHSSERLAPASLPLCMFGGEPQYRGRQIHVGLDAWGLRPVEFGEIEKLIAQGTPDLGALREILHGSDA